ncbi:hypothetical protein D3C83_271450 [compost metagenome]
MRSDHDGISRPQRHKRFPARERDRKSADALEDTRAGSALATGCMTAAGNYTNIEEAKSKQPF